MGQDSVDVLDDIEEQLKDVVGIASILAEEVRRESRLAGKTVCVRVQELYVCQRKWERQVLSLEGGKKALEETNVRAAGQRKCACCGGAQVCASHRGERSPPCADAGGGAATTTILEVANAILRNDIAARLGNFADEIKSLERGCPFGSGSPDAANVNIGATDEKEEERGGGTFSV